MEPVLFYKQNQEHGCAEIIVLLNSSLEKCDGLRATLGLWSLLGLLWIRTNPFYGEILSPGICWMDSTASWRKTSQVVSVRWSEYGTKLSKRHSVFLKLAITGFYPKLKSFWSCSHMNCSQHYTLQINLHILYIYFIKMNLNLKEFQESNKYIKGYQENKRNIFG